MTSPPPLHQAQLQHGPAPPPCAPSQCRLVAVHKGKDAGQALTLQHISHSEHCSGLVRLLDVAVRRFVAFVALAARSGRVDHGQIKIDQVDAAARSLRNLASPCSFNCLCTSSSCVKNRRSMGDGVPTGGATSHSAFLLTSCGTLKSSR